MSLRRLQLLGLLFVAGSLSALYLQTRTSITVLADGELRAVATHASTVAQALHEAGISIYPADIVRPALDARLRPGLSVTIDRAHLVRVEADGHTRALRTQLTSPLAILAAQGLSLGPHDELWVDGARVDPARPAASGAPEHILLRRAVTVTIVDDGVASQFQTAARTVGEALWDAGVRLYRADEVVPAPDAWLTPSATITIHRSRAVTLLADGRSLRTRTRRASVGDVLNDVGLALVGQDYAVPAADQPLPEDGTIRVVRVREAAISVQEAIPYETLYQALASLEIDSVMQVQAGVTGVRQRSVQVRYEDGVEVSRLDEGEFVALAPVPRIIGYGTQIVIRALDTPDGPIEYWRSYTLYATSYSPARAGTPVTAKWYGITASGKRLTKGLVAIDKRLMPFGTRMYVPGYGFAEAADTGSGVKGRWIDLGYDDWNYVSWHQVVTVYFLTPVPPSDQITWIIPTTVP